ncbi:MAG: rubrerythrin family protein [Sedimentisphaerales bacterium]|nr:rubrerythrin family protein [Sedimentisphaerales bacterium]
MEKLEDSPFIETWERAEPEDRPEKDIYVCGVCGNTIMGQPPQVCPICGSGQETFKEAR